MMLSLAVARAPPCATSPAGSASSSVTDACADSAAGNTRHFETEAGGAVFLNDEGRKVVLGAWSELLERKVDHAVLKERIPYGLAFLVQATIVARCVRGDLATYLPYVVQPD